MSDPNGLEPVKFPILSFDPLAMPHARAAPVLSICDFGPGGVTGRHYQISCRCGGQMQGEGDDAPRFLWAWASAHVCGEWVLGSS